jgi:hypothetical protein
MDKPKKLRRVARSRGREFTYEERSRGGRSPQNAARLSKQQRERAKAHPRHGSRHWFQVSLRLTPIQVKMTANLVKRENARMRAAGLKATLSMGGIAYRWFEQGLRMAVAGLARR